MTSASDYFLALRSARDQVALLLGVDVVTVATEIGVADANLAVSAVLAKDMVDHGVLTAAQLQASLDDAVSGADGSVWADVPVDYTVVSNSVWSGEGFEGAASGTPASHTNTAFTRGQVGDSLLPSTGSAVFDSTQHQGGSQSLKVTTSDGYSRALRSPTWFYQPTLNVRFYFRATAAPATSSCAIYAAQLHPADGTGLTADYWSSELRIDSTGKPRMYDNGVERAPGVGTQPNICDGNWWRVEAMFDERSSAGCETRVFGGADLLTTTPTFSWTGTYTGRGLDSMLIGQPRSALTAGQSWTCWFDDVDAVNGYWIGP